MGGAGQYGETGGVVRVDAEDGWSADVPARNCHLVNERDDTLDDLVKSDYLHEAGCAVISHPIPAWHTCTYWCTCACLLSPTADPSTAAVQAHQPEAMQKCVVRTNAIASPAHCSMGMHG